jgi:hypothetical protein
MQCPEQQEPVEHSREEPMYFASSSFATERCVMHRCPSRQSSCASGAGRATRRCRRSPDDVEVGHEITPEAARGETCLAFFLISKN